MQMEKMEKTDEITYMIQTLSKTFPTLLETLVQERDQYMVASLRSVARQSTSVVAVVGRGHLAGIAANWEQDIPVESLLTVPKRKPRQLGLWSAAALAIGGLAFVAGVHHMRNR
jgi:pheromone shutdown protein TraB